MFVKYLINLYMQFHFGGYYDILKSCFSPVILLSSEVLNEFAP